MSERIQTTVKFIQSQIHAFKPEVGVILGSGLGEITNNVDVAYRLRYADIPGFPVSTVAGHSGELIFGQLQGKSVVCMHGRFHYYEGFSMQEVVLPVYVMKLLGVETLIVSNASGGVNPSFHVGDIMLIRDHINLFATNSLIGPNMDLFGPRFPSMHSAYNPQILYTAKLLAKELGIDVQEGVYAGISGPNYETNAEYRYMRIIGADAVGMSTVPEVIAANHAGLNVFGISIISDLGGGDVVEKVTHEEVLSAVNQSTPKISLLVETLIGRL